MPTSGLHQSVCTDGLATSRTHATSGWCQHGPGARPGGNSAALAGKDPAAQRNGIRSSPAHRHSCSADSLPREVSCERVGTAWTEVVWYARISENNHVSSYLPGPRQQEEMDIKTKEEIRDKYSFRKCQIERSFFSTDDSFSKLIFVILGSGGS